MSSYIRICGLLLNKEHDHHSTMLPIGLNLNRGHLYINYTLCKYVLICEKKVLRLNESAIIDNSLLLLMCKVGYLNSNFHPAAYLSL